MTAGGTIGFQIDFYFSDIDFVCFGFDRNLPFEFLNASNFVFRRAAHQTIQCANIVFKIDCCRSDLDVVCHQLWR